MVYEPDKGDPRVRNNKQEENEIAILYVGKIRMTAIRSERSHQDDGVTMTQKVESR